jgi:hypothetical protein
VAIFMLCNFGVISKTAGLNVENSSQTTSMFSPGKAILSCFHKLAKQSFFSFLLKNELPEALMKDLWPISQRCYSCNK